MKLTREQTQEFFERLTGPEGCDFQGKYDDKGELIQDSVTWKCAGGYDKSFAKAILKRMKIPKRERKYFLELCEEFGGHCDCEIIFNVKPKIIGEE